jgi:hypothetical protein
MKEWRLVGYKNPVRTSQETHDVSATEHSLLMLCKNWGFHAMTMKNVVFWDIEPQFIPHRKHITSLLQSWASSCYVRFEVFTAVTMKEWRLVGYKNPVRTSQETHYVSATQLSRLMLCKIWGYHGGDYVECRLLGCNAVWLFKYRSFGATYHHHHQGRNNQRASLASYC